MSETSPVFVIILIILALLVTKLISAVFKIELKTVKYECIDGLRGYLAFFVFIHHSSVYYFFLKAKNWDVPPSNIYTHLGQTSVSMFFMITGFLFFSKLIDSKTRKIDWVNYYVSRFLRLYPMYIISLMLMLFAVFIMSDYKIIEPLFTLLEEIKSWLLFSIFDSPDLNQYNETSGIMAWVTWSIKYEWLFYFSLPVMGLLFFKQKLTIFLLVFSIYAFCYIYFNSSISIVTLYPFITGFIAAILIKNNTFLRLSKHIISSIMMICCLLCSVYFFNTAYEFPSLILTSVAFIFIAGGNTLFGILTLKVSRHLGQLAYSIYILHTTFLFFIFRIIFGFETSHNFSLETFWIIIGCFSIILITISFCAYYFIELPFINYTSNLTKRIRKFKTNFLE